MKRYMIVVLFLILIFTLTGCQDSNTEENVYTLDNLEYEEICFTEGSSALWRIVKLKQLYFTPREFHDTEEVVLGTYKNKEYYFMSNTEYNYYRIEIPKYEGEFFTLLEAKELHEFTVEFTVNECSPFKITEPIYIRDIE